MIFSETTLPGVYRIRLQRSVDARGYFVRTFCREAFQSHGLACTFDQCGIAFNKQRGTARGMHYQESRFPETKLVRCNRGAMHDVVLDVRKTSPAFGRWLSFELTEQSGEMLYIPPGCAHGYQTLADDTEVAYQIAGTYRPESARGIRWDDPAFHIRWPILPPACLSERDRTWPDFTEADD